MLFLLVLASWLVAATVVGCVAGEPQQLPASSANPAGTREAAITVFAAASLAEAFNAVAAEYRMQYPGQEVTLNFDGSQRLRTQLEHGARADVFASADWDQMAAVEYLGLTAIPPANFASNRLALLIHVGSGGESVAEPLALAGISVDGLARRLEELARPGRKIVLGQAEVPIGKYTERMLENIAADPVLGRELADGIRANVVSREASVRGIVQKVNLGEADAGVVYSSDARDVHAGVEALELPDSINPTAHYPIAALTGTQSASRFVEFVLSEKGQRILRTYGFGPPLHVEGDAP